MATTTASNIRIELTGAADERRYLLRSQLEILQVLRDLMRRRSLVTLYYGELNDFILTTVVGVGDDQSTVFLDCAPTAALNRRILAAEKLACVGSHDRVRVQFTTATPRLVEFEGSPAFAVATPDALLRLQRREYYRLVTPVARPLKCTIPLPAEHGAAPAQLNVHDLSLGGISVLTPPQEFVFPIGARFENCGIALPDTGTLRATLEIRNTFEITAGGNVKSKRTGLAFVDLPSSMHGAVQRYILKLERERRAKGVALR